MLSRMQCDIVRECAGAVAVLTRELEDEGELFASPNTLRDVEAHLLAAAQTLAHLSPALQTRLGWIDWRGWEALRGALEADRRPRRDEVWYAVRALLPATVHLIEQLRRVEPVWFEIAY
ncbi:MAG: hypothetical protein DI563_25830 [Variovorax paradoxus]|uniref:DUF86 domain-containing protein n=1 Tax=Variovorax paradoxus TaxID=34073 RepID=A0A2W5RDS2_VARPD|nr:MAG: hypothetical protein DI563_25830 [Variovorax paradoxus]